MKKEITDWYEKNIGGNNADRNVIRENVRDVIYKQKEDILFSNLIENLKKEANIIIMED